jgi:hypothetical protein
MSSDKMARYQEALIREGDAFNPRAWYQRIKEQEAKARPSETPDYPALSLPTFAQAAPSPLIPTPEASSDRKQKASVKHQLSAVTEAWDDFQTSRRRDAVYGFLSAVFALVQRHARRGRARRLRRELCNIMGTKVALATDLFTLVIRAVAEADGIDRKTVSKWSRALRYVAQVKPASVSVRAFMQQRGGVNGCAEQYAAYLKKANKTP